MSHQFGRFAAAVGVIFVSSLIVTAGQRAASTAPAGQKPAAATAAAPTFSKDVAPILYKNCTTCHRPGEAAPMSLLSFQEARPWARAIRDNVVNGLMPPWYADPAHGQWRNERRLTAEEKSTISRWVDAGAPEGNKSDLPPQPTYATGWRIGQPDAVMTMAEAYTVPPTGEIAYQYFEVATNFTEDKWVQALEIRPGAREVVHHVLVYARSPEMTRGTPVFRPANPPGGPVPPNAQQQNTPEARQSAVRRGPLMAQVGPGTDPTVFPPGTALLVKAGTVLTFQIHYTPTGKEAADKTRIGLVFAKQPVTTEVRPAAMLNSRFMIPAGADNHPVESGLEFLEDVTIYSLTPHTHLRGKRWEHKLTYPDGRTEVVLSVPNYNFNWQSEYQFVTPLKVPKGSKLHAVAHYDNSPGNKSNPDAKKDVYWGDQTWEEMQYTGFFYSVDKDRVTTAAQPK